MFILDTDHIGILQRQSGSLFQSLERRMGHIPATDFFITIVSFHEQILGWNAYLARAKDQGGIVRGYSKLEKILADFSRAQVLPFGDAAADIFDDLRGQKVRISTMDLRIAAIALSTGMTVLTRNLVDFQRVPNVNVEDWTN